MIKYKTILGVIMFIGSCMLVAVMLIMVKILRDQGLGAIDILSLRSYWVLLIMSPYILYKSKSNLVTFRSLAMNVPKDIISTITIIIWYSYAISVPLSNSAMIGYLTPIVSVLLAAVIMHEKHNAYVWLNTVFAIIGVVIALSPDFSSYHVAYLWLIAGTTMRGANMVLSQFLIDRQSALGVLANHAIIGWLIFVIIGLYNGGCEHNYTIKQHMMIVAIGALYVLFCLLQYFGMQFAGVIKTQSFAYMQLIFVNIGSWMAFKSVITLNQFIGSVIIIISLLFMSKFLPKKAS